MIAIECNIFVQSCLIAGLVRNVCTPYFTACNIFVQSCLIAWLVCNVCKPYLDSNILSTFSLTSFGVEVFRSARKTNDATIFQRNFEILTIDETRR